MCDDCFSLAPKSFVDKASDDSIVISDAEMKPHVLAHHTTRSTFKYVKEIKKISNVSLECLEHYEPVDDHLFSLFFDTTYFDIPCRAPRWATHGGLDYHGTWIPQIVRWSLLRYTSKGDKVLSNFLGRGTDAIEAFLLQRRLVGVDINPVAVNLSLKNISFPIPEDMQVSAEFRPILRVGDSRHLLGDLFRDSCYDFIL
jgi:hypothetical protein